MLLSDGEANGAADEDDLQIVGEQPAAGVEATTANGVHAAAASALAESDLVPGLSAAAQTQVAVMDPPASAASVASAQGVGKRKRPDEVNESAHIKRQALMTAGDPPALD